MHAPTRETCARCGGPLDRAQVRVLIWERLWIERVAAVVCRRCVAVELTKAGQEKVARLTRAGEDVLGIPGEDPAPAVEVVKVYTDVGRPPDDEGASDPRLTGGPRRRPGRPTARRKERGASSRPKGARYRRRRQSGP